MEPQALRGLGFLCGRSGFFNKGEGFRHLQRKVEGVGVQNCLASEPEQGSQATGTFRGHSGALWGPLGLRRRLNGTRQVPVIVYLQAPV